MPGVPVFHTLGYLYLALVDNTVRPTWTNAARLGTDCIYTVLVAAFEQVQNGTLRMVPLRHRSRTMLVCMCHRYAFSGTHMIPCCMLLCA